MAEVKRDPLGIVYDATWTDDPCPAALPLCVCGVRGCDFYVEHTSAFQVQPRGRRANRVFRRRRRNP